MLKSVGTFLLSIFDLILPPRKDFDIVRKLTPEKINSLPKAPEVVGEDWIHPLFHYKDNKVRAIVWELKYKDNSQALDYIGKLLFDEILALISDIILFDNDAQFLLIPIPITSTRRVERGYNQSEYIARAIVENDLEHILIYAPQWLQKVKDTPKQSHSETRYNRVMNLLDSFEANIQVDGKYIILIDDVVTTGSTLAEARKELLNKGSKNVFAFTIAH